MDSCLRRGAVVPARGKAMYPPNDAAGPDATCTDARTREPRAGADHLHGRFRGERRVRGIAGRAGGRSRRGAGRLPRGRVPRSGTRAQARMRRTPRRPDPVPVPVTGRGATHHGPHRQHARADRRRRCARLQHLGAHRPRTARCLRPIASASSSISICRSCASARATPSVRAGIRRRWSKRPSAGSGSPSASTCASPSCTQTLRTGVQI